MATLKEVPALQAEIDSAPFRGINKDALTDTLESVAGVGGVLSISNGAVSYTFTTNAWGPIFDGWEDQNDTRGVQEGPTPGTPPYEHYLLKANGGGVWSMRGRLKGICDTAGTIRIRPAVVRLDTTIDSFGYNDIHTNLPAGGAFDLSFDAMTESPTPRVAGEKLVLQFRGPNGGEAIIQTGHLTVVRVG